MGESPVRLGALRRCELRKVSATSVPRRLEGDVCGRRSLKAGCLRPDLRRIKSRLRRAMYRSRGRRDRSGREDLGSRVPRGRKLKVAVLGVGEHRVLSNLLDRRDGLGRTLGEPGLALHPLDQLREGDPVCRVEVKDPPQDGIALISDGQNGLQEVGVLAVGLVGGILDGCALPRVASTSQVDQDDTKGPNIVGR